MMSNKKWIVIFSVLRNCVCLTRTRIGIPDVVQLIKIYSKHQHPWIIG